MDSNAVKAYYEHEAVVRYYEEATRNIGLWISEEKVFTRVFKKQDSLIDLGTGTGRIPIGLYELGYCNVIGVDFSRPMIKAARQLAKRLEYPIPFSVADIMCLPFASNTFEGAIFGANGWMQIPGKDNRCKALEKIFALLQPGAFFVFTTHNRDLSQYDDFWREEAQRWALSQQDLSLEIFGDRFYKKQDIDAECYVHIPNRSEVIDALEQSGFRLEACASRSQLAREPEEVIAFSEECLFWVAQKPEKK